MSAVPCSPPPSERPAPGDVTGEAVPDPAPAESAPRRSRLGRLGRLPIPFLALLVVTVFSAGSAVAVVRSGDRAGAAPPRRVPVLPASDAIEQAAAASTTTTTTSLVPSPPPAPAPRTTPVPPPPERAPSPIVKIGEIRIPKIGLVHPIYEGITLTVIDRGPGHWPGSAMPGQLGNAVIAGHRVTHSKPFRNLDQLVPGDEIFFKTDQGEFRYLMTKQEIVGPRDTWIVNPTPDATVTLFACHPPGSARQRIVVRGVYAPLAAPAA